MFKEIFDDIDDSGTEFYIVFKYNRKTEKALEENLPDGYRIEKDNVFSFANGKYTSALIMRMRANNPARWKGSEFMYYKYKLSELSKLYDWGVRFTINKIIIMKGYLKMKYKS